MNDDMDNTKNCTQKSDASNNASVGTEPDRSATDQLRGILKDYPDMDMKAIRKERLSKHLL